MCELGEELAEQLGLNVVEYKFMEDLIQLLHVCVCV